MVGLVIASSELFVIFYLHLGESEFEAQYTRRKQRRKVADFVKV